jgi:hypothetical protein
MTGLFNNVEVPSIDRADIPVGEVAGPSKRRRSQNLISNPRGQTKKPVDRPTSNLRMSRELTLKTAAREYVWLYDYRHGISLGEIASRDRVSVQRVEFGVGRARAQEKGQTRDSVTDIAGPSTAGPRLVPLFPIGHYTPLSACPHKEPIEPGSLLCCMVCHKSGIDQHPGLRRDPLTEPSPEPPPTSGTSAKASKTERGETRKQRRNRQFSSDLS